MLASVNFIAKELQSEHSFPYDCTESRGLEILGKLNVAIVS